MTKITTAVCLLALGAPSILGCSGRSGKQGTSDGTPPVSTDREPAKAAICGMAPTAGGGLRPVVRVFSAMNFKLAAFPELARAVGLDRVTDCESAERYLVGYSEFAAANPGFDLEEPLDDLFAVEDDPPAPPTSEATIESQKIYQGPNSLNNPVVEIRFDPRRQGSTTLDGDELFGHGPGICTGTYIAKNWILTAAHCITTAAVYHCLKAGIDPAFSPPGLNNPNCRPEFSNYGQWRIRSMLPDSTLLTIDRVWALSYVNPKWVGATPADLTKNPDLYRPLIDGGGTLDPHMEDNDVALLYIGDDAILPPHVEEDGAKRLSTVLDPLLGTWTMRGFGWGLPGSAQLRTTGMNGISLQLSANKRQIEGTSNTAQAALCGGDSGGPLLRVNTPIKTNVGTATQSVQVVVGVASTGTIDDDDCTNAFLPGNKFSTWASVAHPTNLEFIKEKIRRWNGNPITAQSGFKCRERPVEGEGNTLQVAECWGFPCRRDLDCDAEFSGAICSRPGRNYTFCPTCDSFPEPACGCMVGQCLPDPRK